jgi:hypothetical protein
VAFRGALEALADRLAVGIVGRKIGGERGGTENQHAQDEADEADAVAHEAAEEASHQAYSTLGSIQA